MEHPLQRLWNKPERLVIGFMSARRLTAWTLRWCAYRAMVLRPG